MYSAKDFVNIFVKMQHIESHYHIKACRVKAFIKDCGIYKFNIIDLSLGFSLFRNCK